MRVELPMSPAVHIRAKYITIFLQLQHECRLSALPEGFLCCFAHLLSAHTNGGLFVFLHCSTPRMRTSSAWTTSEILSLAVAEASLQMSISMDMAIRPEAAPSEQSPVHCILRGHYTTS